MSNLVIAMNNNRTPEVEQLYDLYKQGVVDIYGNPYTETFGLDPNTTVAYEPRRLGISSENPNFSIMPSVGASTPVASQNTGLLSTNSGLSSQEVEALYEDILDRRSDPGGLSFYTGMPYDDVYRALSTSDEYIINEQYKDIFGRPLTYDEREQFAGLTLDEAFAKLEADSRSLQNPGNTIVSPGTLVAPPSVSNPIDAVVNDLVQQQFQTRQITPGSNFVPGNIPTGFFGANDNVAQLYNLGQTPTFRSGVGGYTDMLPSGFEFGVPAQFAQVPIYMRGLFDTGEDESNGFVSSGDARTDVVNQFGL